MLERIIGDVDSAKVLAGQNADPKGFIEVHFGQGSWNPSEDHPSQRYETGAEFARAAEKHFEDYPGSEIKVSI